MAVINQNLQNYTAQDYNPIPPGEYDFEIRDSDVVDTKTGKRMIKLTCRVVGPTHAGRVVFENFLLGQEVAMARLKTLATVSGHPRPDYIQDTQELHGLKFRGNVGIREQDGYAPQNHIKTFKKIDGPGAAATASAPQPAGFRPAAPVAPPAPVSPMTQAPQGFPPPPPPPPMQPSLGAPQHQQPARPAAPWIK
jgi:hypothetical protein